MQLYVDYGDETDPNWQIVAKAQPSAEQPHGPGSLTWDCELTLPNGEVIFIGAVYQLSNRSLGIEAKQNGFAVASVLGFKRTEKSYDPSLTFRTIRGSCVHAKVGV